VFWYWSLGGGLIMFIYVCHIGDLILMVGQGCGLIVYSRNLILIYRKSGMPSVRGDDKLTSEKGHDSTD